LRLLGKLTGYGLCKLDSEQWSIFHSSGVRPSDAALELLASCLMKYNISENGSSVGRQTTGAPLRNSLIAWLIPSKVENSNFEDFVSAPCHLNAQLLAKVAVGLTLRDAQSCVHFLDHAAEESTAFTDVERIYLLSTFDSRLNGYHPVLETKCQAPRLQATTVVCHLKQILMNRVREDTEYAIQNATSEVS